MKGKRSGLGPRTECLKMENICGIESKIKKDKIDTEALCILQLTAICKFWPRLLDAVALGNFHVEF